MSETTRRWLVAYDIPHDARRGRVAHTLEAFGDRVQYSVFVVDAKPAQLVRLRTALLKLLDLSTDALLLVDLGLRDGVSDGVFERLGVQRRIWSEGPPII